MDADVNDEWNNRNNKNFAAKLKKRPLPLQIGFETIQQLCVTYVDERFVHNGLQFPNPMVEMECICFPLDVHRSS